MKKDVVSSTTMSDSIDKFEKTLEQLKKSSPLVQKQEAELQALANTMSLLVSSDDDLMARFRDNLAVFEEYYPQVFDFFKDYTPKKYVVDVVDGFVNAIDIETGNPFYPYPSYLSTKLQFDKFVDSPNIKQFNFSSAEHNEAKFIHVDSLDAMIDLLPEKTQQVDNKQKRKMNNFSSLILFGVGTGYHLEMFAQQCDVACLYIIEPDLDLFYLSLFSIDWRFVQTSFAQKNCQIHISLGEQEDSFFEDMMRKSALNGRFQMANVAGYIHYQSDAVDALLNEFNRRYLEMGQGWGFFDDAVMAIGHTLENLKNEIPLLTIDAIHNTHADKAHVFIVGNGPSLDDSIEAIKAFKDKAVIISCGSALSALYQYGIKPDFHCEQERTFPVAEKIEHSCPRSFLEGIVLLGPTTVHPAVFSMFNKSIMAAKASEPSSALILRDEQGEKLFSAYHFINPTVANTALVMGYNLGFKSFYLFGIDLGHKEDGHHHSKKSIYYTEDEQDIDLYQVDSETSIKIAGNLGGQFICDSFFYQSNTNLSNQILAFDDLHCFNLSDGAAIKGARPMHISAMKDIFDHGIALDKTALINNIITQGVYKDDLSLFNRLVSDLDYQYFEDACQRLLGLNMPDVKTFKEATELLLHNSDVLKALTIHAHQLLQGTVMHMQVVLTQLLYSAKDEKSAVDLFNKGMVFYCQFLQKASQSYRENAEQAHFIEDSKFVVKLRNK